MKCSFDGSFDQTSERDAVPPSLMALIRIIVDSTSISITCQSDVSACTRSGLSISQLLIFNSVKNNRKTHLAHHKHDCEIPLPLCVALKIHATTWKRTLVDAFSSLGLCVTNNRLLQLTSDIGHGVCEHFMKDGVLCPPKMRSGLFTVAVVNNLDHNPSSTTSKNSFHGTSISLMQLPTLECPGQDRGRIAINHASST